MVVSFHLSHFNSPPSNLSLFFANWSTTGIVTNDLSNFLICCDLQKNINIDFVLIQVNCRTWRGKMGGRIPAPSLASVSNVSYSLFLFCPIVILKSSLTFGKFTGDCVHLQTALVVVDKIKCPLNNQVNYRRSMELAIIDSVCKVPPKTDRLPSTMNSWK